MELIQCIRDGGWEKIPKEDTYETDVAARKPRAEYTRGLTIVGEAWDYMGNLTEVVYSISFVY